MHPQKPTTTAELVDHFRRGDLDGPARGQLVNAIIFRYLKALKDGDSREAASIRSEVARCEELAAAVDLDGLLDATICEEMAAAVDPDGLVDGMIDQADAEGRPDGR